MENALTRGRFTGGRTVGHDDEPFEEKFLKLMTKLEKPRAPTD